jgi:HPt (histidine-containing phosphotransfer) domain-containing protein
MEDYISKPVNPEELEVMLGRWIPQSAPASEDPTPETDGATTISTTNGAIDHSVLAGLRKIQQKSKSDFLERLIEVFLSEVPSKLAALREGATRGEAQDLEQRAHNLKGSSASLGALHMASICGELEALGQSGDLKSVPDLLAQLNAEFDRVREALSSAQLRSG